MCLALVVFSSASVAKSYDFTTNYLICSQDKCSQGDKDLPGLIVVKDENDDNQGDSYTQYYPDGHKVEGLLPGPDPQDKEFRVVEFTIDHSFKTTNTTGLGGAGDYSVADKRTRYVLNVNNDFSLAGLRFDPYYDANWDNLMSTRITLNGGEKAKEWIFHTNTADLPDAAIYVEDKSSVLEINAPDTTVLVDSFTYAGFLVVEEGTVKITANKLVITNSRPEVYEYNQGICINQSGSVSINIVGERNDENAGVFISNDATKSVGISVTKSGQLDLTAPKIEVKAVSSLAAVGLTLSGVFGVDDDSHSEINLRFEKANLNGLILSLGDAEINLEGPRDKEGSYTINGDLKALRHQKDGNDIVMLAKAGKINLTGYGLNLTGDATANYGGTINIDLLNGKWLGMANSDTEPITPDMVLDENWKPIKNPTSDYYSKEGFINVKLSGSDAVWNVTDNSQVTSITMNDHGLLNLAYEPTQKLTAPSYRKVTTKTFGGGNGIVGFRTNLDGGTDQLIITDKAEGAHQATIAMSGNADLDHSADWLIQQGGQASSMSFTNQKGKNEFSGRGMVTVWGLGFVPEGDENLLETEEGLKQIAANTTGTGVGNWYLIKQEYFEPDPGQPKPDQPLPDEIVENLSIGTSATQALAYQADLDDLRTRLGEVRYGAQDGAWVKAFTKKEKIGNGSALEQDVNGINVGLDTLVAAQEGSAWLVGGAFRYSNADQEGVALKHVSGELDEYSIKAYATWMHEQGSYADFVLQAGRYKQSLNGLDNTATGSSNAKYRTWGYGGSVEVGHMFSFANDADDSQWTDHWFVEPQLQLAYFHAKGADYHTSTGLKVDQGDADFLMGRAGVAIGKKFNLSDANSLDRRYFQVSAIGGVKHDFIGGDQTIRYTGVDKKTVSVKADELDDTRFYYGVNFDWQLANNWRVYGQVSREEGDQYTKDYDFSLGLKYAF